MPIQVCRAHRGLPRSPFLPEYRGDQRSGQFQPVRVALPVEIGFDASAAPRSSQPTGARRPASEIHTEGLHALVVTRPHTGLDPARLMRKRPVVRDGPVRIGTVRTSRGVLGSSPPNSRIVARSAMASSMACWSSWGIGGGGFSQRGGVNALPKPPKAPFVGSVSWGGTPVWEIARLGSGRSTPSISELGGSGPGRCVFSQRGRGYELPKPPKAPSVGSVSWGGAPVWEISRFGSGCSTRSATELGGGGPSGGVLAKRGGGGTSRQNRQKPFCRFCQLGGTPLRASFSLSRSTQLMVRTSAMG
jgi:hypothetical protein